MNLSGMSIFVPGLGQHGLQNQFGTPSQKQLQILQQQQQLLMHEIALKKAQLYQQQHQHQLVALQQAQAQQQQQQQQQQHQQQQQQQVHQQPQQHHTPQPFANHQFRFQPIHKGSPSPDCSSGTSSPISHFSHRTFDQIEDWEVPSNDLIQRIIQQVEYYFSNEYLTRDAYFLRQIRRKREGYLSMKLITNFKKVRKLVKDPRITSYCLRQSTTLQVNDDGTKVRRIAVIPEDLRRFAVSRSLLLTKVPIQLSSIEALMSIFTQFGDISSVRILRPSKEIPHDLRDILGKNADSVSGISAVVEFETAEAASSAYTRFIVKTDVVLDGISYEINVQLLGIDSNGLGDDDSGCGESSSSGDECAGHDLHYLIEDSNNLEEDYEKYMSEIRKERQSENKTNVPDVIAALMDEYGSGSTVPQPQTAYQTASQNTISSPIRRPSPFEPFNVIGPVRSRSNTGSKTSLWSTNWSPTDATAEDETDSQLQNLLADSALSAFGRMRIDNDDDVFTNDTDGNLIAPTHCAHAPTQSDIVQPAVQIKWADAVRN